MKPLPLRFATAAAPLAALLLTTPALADGPAPAGVWVDAQPWTCAREIGPLARHVELACDALGSACQVAATVKEAAFRATLTCEGAEAWTIDLQKIDGTDVFKLTLEGDREQRLRKAAIWVAHASVGEPPPRSTRAAAPPSPEPSEPEPVPAMAAPPAAVAPPRPPPAPQVPAPPGSEPDAAEPTGARASRGGLHLSGFGAATNANGSDFMAGGRIAAGFGLSRLISIGPAFTYARSAAHESGSNLLLGGAAIGLGAPFGGRWVGASLEGGAGASIAGDMATNRRVGPGGPSMTFYTPDHHTDAVAYARAALILQAPIDFALRPTLSLAAMHVTDVGGSPAELAMLDLGVVWPGW